METYITEMQDRQNRMSNIIISNIKESNQTTRSSRILDDTNTIKAVLSPIDLDDTYKFKIQRLEKFDPEKNRLIKVILPSRDHALNILRNKNKITIPGVKIFGDQTKAQKEYYLHLKRQLTELGDDSKTIKYINNVPRIVSKSSTYKKKLDTPNIPYNIDIVYINIQSFLCHRDQVINSIACYNPPLILLSETRTTEDMENVEISICNYNVLRCDASSRRTGDCFNVNSLKNMLDSLGLKQIVREPTRTTNISSTLIDYVITNRNDVIADVYDKPNISDHSVIAVNIVMNLDQNETVTTYRNFSVNNIQKIIQKLHEIDWNIDSENPNDNVCPIVTKRGKCNYLPWYDHEVRNTVQLRDKAYIYFKTTQNIEIKHFYWQNYKQHRNHVRQYYENKIDNNKNNPKEMWRTIKSLVDNKSRYFSNNNIIFNTDNSLIIATTEKEIADYFNYYFVNSIENIISTIPSTPPWSSNYLNTIASKFNSFKLLTNEDLNRIILSLGNKMNNNDPYSAGMIKNTITVLGPTLLTLINLSLQTGVVPDKLKISTITPIEKNKKHK
ncbi:hypothetical protein NQ318_002757 [Aromia moschata]|uniref:Uncharacterized protein n=1 Tax=Aromia moschata TaxID=1265417 RepID=A0AAV8Y332_9CUCU|nr:hypothetical protein NQ318_002757 [Aromia moschata]